MAGQSPAGGPDSVPEQGPSDQPSLAPYNPPGPGSADFNPNDFIWDGGTWRSPDRRYWWDGSQWTSGEQPVHADITSSSGTQAPTAAGPAIGLGCISMVVGVIAIAGSGACSSAELPGFALVVGVVGIALALAAAAWVSVRKGHPALYLLPVMGLLVSVPAMAFGIRGSC